MKALASLLLVLSTLQGVSSFVFSCEEIKAKLVNSPRIEPSTYACVFLEEGLAANTAYLNTVYLQDSKDKTSYSLGSVAATSTGCVKGSGPWQVISDQPNALLCNQEIALIFNSDETTEFVSVTQAAKSVTPKTGRVAFVSPGAGMRVTANNIDTDLTISTGAGKGENEFKYQLASWSVWEVPRYIVTFDNVITIDTSKNAILYVTSNYADGTRLGPGDHAVVLSSGASDNVMNKHPQDNIASYDLWEAATATVRGNMTFDPAYQGFINISVRGDYMNEERRFTDSEFEYVFYANKFQVKYLTTVKPDDLWDNSDSFVIEIWLSELPSDITPMPTTENTETTEQAYSAASEAQDVSFQPSQPAPVASTQPPPTQPPPTYAVSTAAPAVDNSNYCKCGIVDDWFEDDWDPATIWVDVVIILDTSAAMGDSLEEAKAVITSFIGLMSTDVRNQYFSRVGFISMAQTPQVIYNLNMTNTDELNMVHKTNIPKIDVGAAFQAALQMFADGIKLPGYKDNTRQIIYYMTNSAPGSNLNGVEEFKTNGGVIIVNDFVLEDEVPDPLLKNLASEGYFFTDLSANFINSLAVFCEANCFCDPSYHPFNDDIMSPRTLANRGCFHPVNTGIPQAKARTTCQSGKGSLVSIHDAQKEFFVNSVVSMYGNTKKYWIGYENVNGQFVWDDKSTNPFTDWDSNQPDTSSSKNCVYAVRTTGLNVKWSTANCNSGANIYICEYPPCSRGNSDCKPPEL